MKISCSKRRLCSGQFLAEAAIGLALMTFTWIILSYSLYMADNDIRTEMAARYAAWFRGSGSSDASASQIDQYFFYQSGLSTVTDANAKGIGDVLTSTYSGSGSDSSSDSSTYSADEDGPFMEVVTYGVAAPTSASPFPFNLLSTQLPLMPTSMLTEGLTVKSSCQWDDVGDTWNSPGAAFSGIVSTLKSTFEDMLKNI